MSDTQKRKGFTQIENDLLEKIFLFPFTRTDLAIIVLTIRFTLGYQKKQSAISITRYAKYIRSDRTVISRSLQKLIRSSVIKVAACGMGSRPRILQFNEDYSQWDLPPLDSPVLHEDQHLVLHGGQHLVLHGGQHLVLHGGQQYLNKYINKIKETNSSSSSSSNIIYLIRESEMKENENNNNNTALILNDIEKRLKDLYQSCFSFQPNVYETEAIKREIFMDDRFNTIELLKIIQESFHRVATYDKSKRNTNYVLKVIQSKKQELFLRREKERKEMEKRQADLKKKTEEYIPGTIFGAYEKEMAERRKRVRQ